MYLLIHTSGVQPFLICGSLKIVLRSCGYSGNTYRLLYVAFESSLEPSEVFQIPTVHGTLFENHYIIPTKS